MYHTFKKYVHFCAKNVKIDFYIDEVNVKYSGTSATRDTRIIDNILATIITI